MAEGDAVGPTSAEREQFRAEVARVSAGRSVRLSAWAWGILAVSTALVAAGSAWAGSDRSAPVVLALTALFLVTPIAFVVLTILAVRAAWRGLDSGHAVSRWANVLAILDVLGSITILVGFVFTVVAIWAFAQCASDPSCQLFQF